MLRVDSLSTATLWVEQKIRKKEKTTVTSTHVPPIMLHITWGLRFTDVML